MPLIIHGKSDDGAFVINHRWVLVHSFITTVVGVLFNKIVLISMTFS
jgi:hypothetical protein